MRIKNVLVLLVVGISGCSADLDSANRCSVFAQAVCDRADDFGVCLQKTRVACKRGVDELDNSGGVLAEDQTPLGVLNRCITDATTLPCAGSFEETCKKFVDSTSARKCTPEDALTDPSGRLLLAIAKEHQTTDIERAKLALFWSYLANRNGDPAEAKLIQLGFLQDLWESVSRTQLISPGNDIGASPDSTITLAQSVDERDCMEDCSPTVEELAPILKDSGKTIVNTLRALDITKPAQSFRGAKALWTKAQGILNGAKLGDISLDAVAGNLQPEDVATVIEIAADAVGASRAIIAAGTTASTSALISGAAVKVAALAGIFKVSRHIGKLASNAADCLAHKAIVCDLCGNGTMDPGEGCDHKLQNCVIDAKACNDQNACTKDVYEGMPSDCSAVCKNFPIHGCHHDDGCCPAGCTTTNDNDCLPSCGNGVPEADEECDGMAERCTDLSQNFTQGSAACVGCKYVLSECSTSTCGNGKAEPGELCDGQDTRGLSCSNLGLGGGRLACWQTCGALARSGCDVGKDTDHGYCARACNYVNPVEYSCGVSLTVDDCVEFCISTLKGPCRKTLRRYFDCLERNGAGHLMCENGEITVVRETCRGEDESWNKCASYEGLTPPR